MKLYETKTLTVRTGAAFEEVVYALMPKGASRLARVTRFLDFYSGMLKLEA